MVKNNSPLAILIIGIVLILIVALSVSPTVQGNVARLLNSSSYVSFLEETLPSETSNDVETAFVSRVVDGDTIVLNDGRSIRYLYVDTPETVKPGTPVECFGPEAKRLNQILVEGTEINLIADRELEDRYGRDLRIVFLKGKNTSDVSQSVNAELVKRGYARTKIYKPNDLYEEDFLEFQSIAEKNSLGLWSACKNS